MTQKEIDRPQTNMRWRFVLPKLIAFRTQLIGTGCPASFLNTILVKTMDAILGKGVVVQWK